MNNWQIYSLQDVAEFKTGKLNSNAANENGEYPFFTCSPETLKINEYAFDCEALLLAGNNAEGNFALKYYNGKFNAYQRTYVITVHDPKRITYKFLFYNLKTQLKELQNISAGSATKFLTMSIINEIELKLPPLEEQKAIASVLSSLDDKIDLLHRQNTTLEAMAETLFRQWFVEEAQEDWEDVQITKLFDVRDGTHDSPKQKTTGKPLITSKHINGNRLDFESAYLISDDDFDKINQRSKVDKHDILISMIGTIGLIYLEQSDEVNYAIKNVGLFKTSQNQNWRAYTYFWLKSNVGKQFLDEHVSGSTQEYVSLGSFRSIAFKKPPIENLDEFNKIANGYLNKIKNNSAQIQTLEKLRENLLPKLMSGEVRVDQQYE